jgi:glycosyltransferase involved in cell wall biosynthesis
MPLLRPIRPVKLEFITHAPESGETERLLHVCASFQRHNGGTIISIISIVIPTAVENAHGTLSVLMPNYNHAHLVGEALRSLLGQSFKPSEIIIVDDASTDNSLEVLESYAQREPSIRIVRNERNQGVICNLNRLTEWASSDYVMFLAADDQLLPGFFEKSMGVLALHPAAGLCSSRTWVQPSDGREKFIPPDELRVSTPIFIPSTRARTLLLSQGNWIHGNTCVYRRTALQEAGGFLPELQSLTDSFAAQVIALRHGACFIPEPLAIWRYSERGYAATTFSLENAPRIMSRAAELMRSEFKDAFPAGYDRIWEQETFFTFARVTYRAIRVQQDAFLEQQRIRQKHTNLLNRASRVLLRLLMDVQGFITLCYLVSGYWPRQAAKRRLNKTVAGIRWFRRSR